MTSVFKTVMASAVAAMFAIGSSALAEPTKPPPKPKVDCTKNPDAKGCKKFKDDIDDDSLFYAGYWLARKGDYATALSFLERAKNKDDVRILTYIGFTTRKLGDVDKAMGFYQRALAIDGNFTSARAYMGEAFLQKGDRVSALKQLDEIEQRCGTTCDDYKGLADALAKS